LVLAMASSLVDHPEDVVVEVANGDNFMAFEVSCRESDAGCLVGSRGRYAEAMRVLLMAAASCRGLRITIQFQPRQRGGLQAQ
jgi:hypothetical protein